MKTMSYIGTPSPTWRDLPIDLISKSPIARWAPVPLRLIVGYGFMEHGFAKLARSVDAFPAILQALGVPAPHLMGWLTILVEIVGGLAVLLGALVPLASIPMAAVLLVAIVTVHLPYGFSSIKLQAVTAAGAQFGPPGFETDLLYLACLAALVLGGSGPLAIDGVLAKRREIARPWSHAKRSPPVKPAGREIRMHLIMHKLETAASHTANQADWLCIRLLDVSQCPEHPSICRPRSGGGVPPTRCRRFHRSQLPMAPPATHLRWGTQGSGGSSSRRLAHARLRIRRVARAISTKYDSARARG